MDYARGWLTTKITEDGFRILRKKSTANDNKCLARKVRWLGLVESELFAEANRSGIDVTSADRDAGAGIAIEPALFSGSPAECTISAEDLDSITDARSSYPSLSPERFHAAGLRWMAYRLAGSFEHLQQQWLSMFLVPGTIVRNVQLGLAPGLILLSCQYFAVVWHARVIKAPEGGTVVSLLPAPEKQHQPFQLLQVSGLGPEWEILGMKGIAPRVSRSMLGASGYQLGCKRIRKAGILEVAARNCFKGCGVPWLAKLYRFVGIPGAPPSTEAALCRALIKHALPEATDEEMSELLKLRSSRGSHDVVGSVLEHDEALAHAQEAMVEGDRAELRKAVDHQRVARGAKPRASDDGERPTSADDPANVASSSGGALLGRGCCRSHAATPTPRSNGRALCCPTCGVAHCIATTCGMGGGRLITLSARRPTRSRDRGARTRLLSKRCARSCLGCGPRMPSAPRSSAHFV